MTGAETPLLAALARWSGSEALAATAAALLALLAFLALAPRGRRGLARWPLAFLLLCPFAAAIEVALPGTAMVARAARFALRFLALASVLQSLLLVGAVGIWERFAAPLPRILLDLFRGLLTAAALLAALREAGVAAAEIFTGSALVTAVLGFALRDTLGNIFAGLAIHLEHPFELGDWIRYDDDPAHTGEVVEINWRATKLVTNDAATIIVPNGQLAQASIQNLTRPDPWTRRTVTVPLPVGVPTQFAQSILLGAVRGGFGVREVPAPSVVTAGFSERGIDYAVRFFTSEIRQRDVVDGMARDRIWYALARHGIAVPAPGLELRPERTVATGPGPRVGEDHRVEVLGGVALFAGLARPALEGLARESREHAWAPGEVVARQGEPGSSLFVVVDGAVEVHVRDGDGPPVFLRRLGPGDWFGEASLLTGQARSATVTAACEVRLLEVGKTALGPVLEVHPELVEQLGAVLRRRLAEREQALAASGHPAGSPHDVLGRIREFFGI